MFFIIFNVSLLANQSVFETLNINAHLLLEVQDTASGKSHVGVIGVQNCSCSKIYNARKIIDVYQKQQWTKYRAPDPVVRRLDNAIHRIDRYS